MKKGDFLWSAYRITEKQKAGKARNIKEKQLKNSRSTASKPLVAHLSSASADFGRFTISKQSKSRKTLVFRDFLISARLIQKKITPTFSVSVTVAILISDTKCGIERNDFFIVLKAEVFGRELDSISGLVGVHIDL